MYSSYGLRPPKDVLEGIEVLSGMNAYGLPGASRELVQHAEQAGYEALVLTVDAPNGGARDRERRANFRLPPHVSAVNLAGIAAPALAHAGHHTVDGQRAAAHHQRRGGCHAGAGRWRNTPGHGYS